MSKNLHDQHFWAQNFTQKVRNLRQWQIYDKSPKMLQKGKFFDKMQRCFKTTFMAYNSTKKRVSLLLAHVTNLGHVKTKDAHLFLPPTVLYTIVTLTHKCCIDIYLYTMWVNIFAQYLPKSV